MLRCIIVLGLLAPTCLAQDSLRMDQAVQPYVSKKQFMGSVLVARGNKVLLSRSYGYADLAKGIPNTPATKFRIGSITKQFTAAAILILEERGQLKIKDPIRKYLPDPPTSWDKITFYHLLTHTSGIPDTNTIPEIVKLGALPHTPEQLVALFRERPLEFPPGSRMRYSNSGYLLLGYLIEKVSGQTYQDFLRKNVFIPLGMKDTDYDPNSDIIPRLAIGYSPGSSGPTDSLFVHMSNPFSTGGLYSTTGDLLRWEHSLFGGKVLSAASLDKMTTPYLKEYALGLEVHVVNGRTQISHGGMISGFNAYLAYFPDTEVTIAVLANINGQAPVEITNHLSALTHGKKVILNSDLRIIVLSAGILIVVASTLFFFFRPEHHSTHQNKIRPGAASDTIIDIHDLHFSYSSLEVLHGISFRIRRGEMVGFLGPNGAGKSTTIKILAGIQPTGRGKVHIAGYPLPEQQLEAQKIIGYLPESPLMYECLSGQEFLELMGRLQGLGEKVLHKRIRALLEAFDLINVRVPRISGYSKGMRQKILLSAALLHDPEILLLDEPLSGLDVDASILIKDLLTTLSANGKTILYSSHVLDVVEKVCDRVILIDHGTILADAPLEQLKARTGQDSLETIFRKLTHSEDTAPKIGRVMEALQS